MAKYATTVWVSAGCEGSGTYREHALQVRTSQHPEKMGIAAFSKAWREQMRADYRAGIIQSCKGLELAEIGGSLLEVAPASARGAKLAA